MADLTFVWDENKNRLNQHKHGVAFEEARTVFYDEDAKMYDRSRPFDDGRPFHVGGIESSPPGSCGLPLYRENES